MILHIFYLSKKSISFMHVAIWQIYWSVIKIRWAGNLVEPIRRPHVGIFDTCGIIGAAGLALAPDDMEWYDTSFEAVVAQNLHFLISQLRWHRRIRDFLVVISFILFWVHRWLLAKWTSNIILHVFVKTTRMHHMSTSQYCYTRFGVMHIFHTDGAALL